MRTRDSTAPTHTRQFVGGESMRKLEEYSAPQTKHYWISHKKVGVDLMESTPFALERQLEDQRFLISENRNPQLAIPTRADKTRSQQMLIRKGATRNIAIKARVLNKIVREESGHHTYTLMPPMAAEGDKEVNEEIDPETHPLFRPYALEAHSKPTVMSFGHRPGSASRTFNPATMKIRLHHGAVAKQEKSQNACGYGIPVAVLTKVLHAPDLPRPGDEIPPPTGMRTGTGTGTGMRAGMNSSGMLSDPNNLFPTTAEMTAMGLQATNTATSVTAGTSRKVTSAPHTRVPSPDSPIRSVTAGAGGGGGGIYSSGSPGNQSRHTVLSAISQETTRRKLPKQEDVRWNEGFHVTHEKASEKYKLRCSGIDLKSNLTLTERLHRYAKITVAEAQITHWCPDKQRNDRLVIQTGKPVPTKASSHVFGENYEPYQDKTKNRITNLQRNRDVADQKKEEKRSTERFAELARDIPDVKYNPLSALQLMRSGDRALLYQHAADTGRPDVYLGSSGSLQHAAEKEFVQALGAARRGDKRALLDYYMSKGVEGRDNGSELGGVEETRPQWMDAGGGARPDASYTGYSPGPDDGYDGGLDPERSSNIASPQWYDSDPTANSVS